MQSSNQQGASERRYDDHLEEVCWDNGQFLAVSPFEKGESSKPMKASTSASHFSMNAARQLVKDHSLDVVGNEDRRAAKFPLHVPAVEPLDWLDDSLNDRKSIAMPRNSMLAGTSSYEVLDQMNRTNFLPQDTSIRGDPEGVARTLCSPLMRNGFLNIGARGGKMPIISSMQASNTMQEHFDKSSSATLNPLATHCISSAPMQSSQNTLFVQSSGDAAVFSASHAELIPNLQGASNCTNSYPSVDISRPSDVESMLPDSSEPTHMSFSTGSGHSPTRGNKAGDVSGNKKARASDDFDSESEGSYDDAVALKRPRLGQAASTKRTRAAGIHNQSERNRRGRINEKLKALQELIPNVNKTDKASVLSSVIDYLKKLRLQLQIMCCRNGMNISPLLVSQGVHHRQGPLNGTAANPGTEAATAFGVDAASESFPGLPNAGSASAQVCLGGSMGLPEVQGSVNAPYAPFMSTDVLHSSGIPPATYGPTPLTLPDSFHHPFQV